MAVPVQISAASAAGLAHISSQRGQHGKAAAVLFPVHRTLGPQPWQQPSRFRHRVLNGQLLDCFRGNSGDFLRPSRIFDNPIRSSKEIFLVTFPASHAFRHMIFVKPYTEAVHKDLIL